MANNYIFNEKLSWTVNWVNKIFTSVYPISQVESIRVGFVDYTNFTFTWNTVTLTDAPNQDVFIDYFLDNSPIINDPVNFIYNETLVGSVDWVNTTFTTSFPISSIEELRVGWIAYTNFSYNWKTIVLATAPTIIQGSPTIDYYKASAYKPLISSWTTFSQLRDDIYTQIGQTIASLQYPQKLVDLHIKEGLKTISNLKTNRKKVSVYSFNKAKDWRITSYSANNLNVGIIPTYTPSKWKIVIGSSEFVDYYNTTSTSFINLVGLEITPTSEMRYSVWYRIPNNIKLIAEVYLNGFKLTPMDIREFALAENPIGFYQFDNYLFLPYSNKEGDIVTVFYTSDTWDLSEDSSVIDFEGDYMKVLRRYVLKEVYHDREDEREDRAVIKYKEDLREYKSYIWKNHDGINNVIKTGWPLG